MWRSIVAASKSSKNLGRKVLFLPNTQVTSSSSSCKVLLDHANKCFHSSSSSFITYRLESNSWYRNLRFLSQSTSSISDLESENHDVSSSSEEDVGSSQDCNFTPEVDGIDGNNGAQMGGLGSVDGLRADFDGNGENIGAQMSGFGSADGLRPDFDGNGENNGAQMSGFSAGDPVSEVVDVEKLENVLSLLQSSVDGSLESSLDGMELMLNEEFMMRVIETPLVPGEHLIRFFRWASSKKEYDVANSAVLGSLARVICNEPKRKNAYALWDLVKEIGEGGSGVVNVAMLNQLISAFSKMGKGKAAFEVFSKSEELGCVPDADTYYLTIEALCRRSFYDWAALVCQKMINAGMLPESDKVGDIISFYCKGLRSKDAHLVYLAAKQNKKLPSQRAVNFMISCLSKGDETVHLAQELLVDFSGEVRKHAINPFSWVVRGLCRKNDIEGAKKLLSEMIEKGPPPGNAVFNTLINAQSKAGDLEDAKETLRLMESRGLKPDVFAYSVIISGYAKGGSMKEACLILSEARKKHPKLCPATFHTLIRGYCKLGEFDKAVKLLSDMKKYGVEPNVDEYNKLIQSLCLKALDWKTAEKLLEEMNEKGLHLPGISRGLINAVKELEQEAVVSEEVVPEA